MAKTGSPGVSDLYGVFYLSLASLPSVRDYYNTMAVLTPLVRSEPWLAATTGFYISARDALLRLLFFTLDAAAPSQVLASWRESGLMQPQLPDAPRQVEVARDYGGQEAPFRTYLCSYTPIGLDLVERDLPRARRLFAAYRLQTQLAHQPARAHFEPTFLELSGTYASLSEREREHFWTDFTSRWDWEHMFINMVLAVDWDYRTAPRPPLEDDEVDKTLLRQLRGL